MNFAQLVQLYFERSVALQNYWTLYVVVIGGLLAFSSLRQSPNRLTTILVSVLFLAFAYKNCGAIVDTLTQRGEVHKLAEGAAARGRELATNGMSPDGAGQSFTLPTVSETTPAGARTFHYFCDALTVLTLWSMEWRRRAREREAHVQVVSV
jgi:hypothetical protein